MLYSVAIFLTLVPPAGDPLLEEAILAAREYTSKLPDFVCRQLTRRYVWPRDKPKPHPADTVGAEVAYSGGREEYRWVMRNGLPVDSEAALLHAGTWTRGEWGSLIHETFAPEVQAQFVEDKPVTQKGVAFRRYRFSVGADRSRWAITVDGRLVRPAYSGIILIDPAARRIVRIEIETSGLPLDFPATRAISTLDFGWVEISGRQYLLPARANFAFFYRRSLERRVNEIEFFGYRKFQAESRIVAEENVAALSVSSPSLAPVYAAALDESRQVRGRRCRRIVLTGKSLAGDSDWERVFVSSATVSIGEEEERGAEAVSGYADYHAMLSALFQPGAGAEFTDGGMYQLEPDPIRIVFFRVPQDRSMWLVESNGRQIHPAYSGALLVDANSSRICSFSMRATGLPPDFGFERVEKTFLFLDSSGRRRLEPVPVSITETYCPRGLRLCQHFETRYAPK